MVGALRSDFGDMISSLRLSIASTEFDGRASYFSRDGVMYVSSLFVRCGDVGGGFSFVGC